MEKIAKFEVSKIYSCRSVCDSNCIFSFEVISRTEKTVTIKSRMDGVVTKKIKISDNAEYILPMGSYSMSPLLRAN